MLPAGYGQVFSIQSHDKVLYPTLESAYWVDSTKSHSFEEARKADFQAHNETYYNFGYDPDVAFWVRLRLRNETDYHNWRLLSFISYFDHLDYWEEQSDSTWEHIRTGRSFPFDSRQSLEHVGFTFKPELPQGQTRTLYFRLQGQNPMTFPLELMPAETFVQRTLREHLYYGFYFGVLIVMLLYNLFVAITLRDKTYFYYIGSIACTFLIFSSSTGYLFKYVHPGQPAIALYLVRIFMGLIVTANSAFALSFLHIREHSTFFYRAFLGLMGAAVLAILLSVTDVLYSATNSLISIHAVFLLAVGVWVWRKKSYTARYYVLAWVAYMAGGITITLRNAGLLPVGGFTLHAVEVGSMLEVILLSFALADRYRALRREKEAAVRKTIAVQERANRELEQKVKTRTLSLQERNEELSHMNEELDTTLNTVQLQKYEIEQQNRQIHASIKSAQRIQTAIMPSERFLQQNLREVFVLNRPRDTVSGDFYYTLQRQNRTVLALADCTGHGIPGAFMSMMGVNLMERVFSESEERSPQEAVVRLDRYLTAVFDGSESRIREGMDTGLCLIDHEAKQLSFSGAKLDLVQVREGKAIRHRGSQHPLGGDRRITPDGVPAVTIDYQPDDRFFLFSDGFQDQFGGVAGRKFLSHRFRQLLAEGAQLPCQKQKEHLEHTLDEWIQVGGEKQTDDILVIGFAP